MITNISSFSSTFGIKNSTELADQLSRYAFPSNTVFDSFDIKDLFTSILIRETHSHAEAVFSAGSPLSPPLAEIFLDNFEEKLFHSGNQLPHHILFWRRYVDDIICTSHSDFQLLNSFLVFLNSIHPSISFALETSTNGTLNFLDLSISLVSGKLHFVIFHKPTYTNHAIPNFSSHHYSHKHALFHSLIHRLLHNPFSTQNFQKELNTIKYIAQINNYNPNLIHNLLNKKLKKLTSQNITPSLTPLKKEPTSWRTIPFHGPISNAITNLFS
ncbi:hypothetical protein J437_LFUL008173 [Ladona fulva]|uniref:Helix-turn-helix domain-containing protein n=1 Tax=Ladona fulva TaxID=123851 RepID=A0A8K0KKS9_LADFU|nr:hypothetical protein J437_LFUL008173 [Ladona fulva]